MTKRSQRKKAITDATPVLPLSAQKVPRPVVAGPIWLPWLQALVIVLATLWIYSPVLHGDWIWDDVELTADDSILHDPAGLGKIWFHPGVLVDYQPITVSLEWIEWHFWGHTTLGYHLVNVLLHAVSALLVWRLLAKFGLRLAWLGGLLFAVHPLAVESVAWISELKNTLSLPPFLLAICFYLDYDEHGKKRDYFLALGLYLVAMLCKPSMVMFPLVMLLYAWWKRGKIGWKDVIASGVFVVVSITLVFVTTCLSQNGAIGDRGIPTQGLVSRLDVAGLAIAFYFAKFFLPLGFLPIYPKWPVDPPALLQFLPWPILAGFFYFLWRKRSGWGRPLLLGLGFFLLNLVPVFGLVALRYTTMTWSLDHMAYIPMIGLIGLVAAGLGHISKQLSGPFRLGGVSLLTAAIVLLAVESHWYSGLFINGKTLWTYTLQYNPTSDKAHANLGMSLANEGRMPEAIEQYRLALRLDHENAEAHYDLGNNLRRLGQIPEALEQYELAVQIKPGLTQAQINLGQLLQRTGHSSEALDHLEIAAQLAPTSAKVRYDLAVALMQKGRVADALAQCDEALQLNPSYAECYFIRGNLHFFEGDQNGALADFNQAIQLSPQLAGAHFRRATILQIQGHLAEALSDLQQGCLLAPKDSLADYARLSIWLLRAQMNQKAEADGELAAALGGSWNAAPGDWVSSLARFLLDQIKEPDLLALANGNATPNQVLLCEAWYFAGMKNLALGDKAKAVADLQNCLATQQKNSVKFILAQAELKSLGAH